MNIYDCFLYFDEDLMLDLRLNTLYEKVNKFIIVEAGEDHVGNKRSHKFNINNFKKFKDKIDYYPIDKIKLDPSIKIPKNWSKHHLRDQSLRNFLGNCIKNVNDNDWIIISDIDEIPNPKKIENFNIKKKYAFFKQKIFSYKFNLQDMSSGPWYGSRICVKKYLKSPQWLRNIKIKKNFKNFLFNYQIIDNGGWHFTTVKSPEDIIVKIKSFAHSELNKPYLHDIIYLKNKIENRQDIFNRDILLKKVDLDETFPDYLLTNREKFEKFII